MTNPIAIAQALKVVSERNPHVAIRHAKRRLTLKSMNSSVSLPVQGDKVILGDNILSGWAAITLGLEGIIEENFPHKTVNDALLMIQTPNLDNETAKAIRHILLNDAQSVQERQNVPWMAYNNFHTNWYREIRRRFSRKWVRRVCEAHKCSPYTAYKLTDQVRPSETDEWACWARQHILHTVRVLDVITSTQTVQMMVRSGYADMNWEEQAIEHFNNLRTS